jgi:hypothetical protein
VSAREPGGPGTAALVPRVRSGIWALVAGAVLSAISSTAARADLKVRSPLVEYGEFEFEHNGFVALGGKGTAVSGSQSYTFSANYGLLPFWGIELETSTAGQVGTNLRYNATTLENTFELAPEGTYFADFALFASYEQSTLPGTPNALVAGPIVQKRTEDVFGIDSLHRLNLFLQREVGPSHTNGTGLLYAWQSKLLLHPLAAPGFELFGAIADLGHAGRYNDQYHSIGPVLTGAVRLPSLGAMSYEIGYQFGLTGQTPRSGVRWRFEWELPF